MLYIHRDILGYFEKKTLIQDIDTNNESHVVRAYRPNANDSKSVELRFMSVRVGLGVPFLEKLKSKNLKTIQKKSQSHSQEFQEKDQNKHYRQKVGEDIKPRKILQLYLLNQTFLI